MGVSSPQGPIGQGAGLLRALLAGRRLRANPKDLQVQLATGQSSTQAGVGEFRCGAAYHPLVGGHQDAVTALQHGIGVQGPQPSGDGVQP